MTLERLFLDYVMGPALLITTALVIEILREHTTPSRAVIIGSVATWIYLFAVYFYAYLEPFRWFAVFPATGIVVSVVAVVGFYRDISSW